MNNSGDIISFENAANAKVYAILTETAIHNVFDYEDSKPKNIKKGYRGYVPWGEDNELPYQLIEKIRKDEVMSSNMWFNICTAYGRGFSYQNMDGTPVQDPEILKFFRRNNMIKFWVEQFTDIKHFYFSVMLVVLDREGKKIVQIKHIENVNVRFETCDQKTGRIDHVFVGPWKDKPTDNNVVAYPVLDENDPVGDLLVKMGKEPDPGTGKKNNPTKDRVFAVVTKIPTPGNKYYPFPYYASTFNSGWADLKAAIPEAKKAKMRNGMQIKYQVELHKDYFDTLFKNENITSEADKKTRKKTEIDNITNFLSGQDNQNKSWLSTYYIDPNGKEQRMVRINVIANQKEGGEYIEDSEEASNIISYAMGVHPSLIGASPGKNKNLSGTEARELFTMKQALEKLTRDMLLIPFEVLNDFNGWNLSFSIPDLLLTTLDKGTDAVISNANNIQNDTQDA